MATTSKAPPAALDPAGRPVPDVLPREPEAETLPLDLPLCVDLDGTLLRSDLLVESAFAALRGSPLRTLSTLAPLLMRGDRAGLKHALAEDLNFDVARLPFRSELVEHVRTAQTEGRRTVLVTASNERYAKAVAEHLGCFDEVMASTATVNLKGDTKACALVERFGERSFEYVGDSLADVPVWRRSAAGIVVAGSRRVQRAAESVTRIDGKLGEPPADPATALLAMRPHQWLKNMLVFVPVLAGHQLALSSVAAACVAFAAFCMAASSAYLLNDLLDLDADRSHPSKRHRPLAAGTLPLATALGLIPALAAGAFIAALALPASFIACLAAYLTLTVAYSLSLKRRAVVDVMTLAALYTLRVVAGGVAVGIELSFWLLAFSMFLFLSLALVKRTAEVQLYQEAGHDLSRRGYGTRDAELLRSMGIASGYLAVLVIALYVNSDDVSTLYGHPEMLWLLCPGALYWMNRVWLKTSRGEMHDDPLIFTVKDRASQLLGAASVVILLGAL